MGQQVILDKPGVLGAVLRDDRVTATGHSDVGALLLPGAHISGELSCTGAQLTNEAGPVLDLREATLGSLVLASAFETDGAWSVRLSGLTYQDIPQGASLEWWLILLREDHTPEYAAQPWQQLAAAAGLGLLAGHIHITATQYVAGHTKATTTPGAPCSTVEQIGLGVDLGLPLIKTNVRTRCDLDSTSRPGQWITAASWGLQVLSWGAATLVIAGYTGVVRRT